MMVIVTCKVPTTNFIQARKSLSQVLAFGIAIAFHSC